MSSEVRILSNNCQHFIRIWLFLPQKSETHSLSLSCPRSYKGGASKDNNNDEAGCDLIFNATTPSTILYTNWKLCECVCLSLSSLSPCVMITSPQLRFERLLWVHAEQVWGVQTSTRQSSRSFCVCVKLSCYILWKRQINKEINL